MKPVLNNPGPVVLATLLLVMMSRNAIVWRLCLMLKYKIELNISTLVPADVRCNWDSGHGIFGRAKAASIQLH